mmetsp:Transcript_28029/g.77107  ORF Transcript_28029/g.77107 Transcript_28029/m.77107 type:complete len:221 (-) Transcript_28029:204-866(-)
MAWALSATKWPGHRSRRHSLRWPPVRAALRRRMPRPTGAVRQRGGCPATRTWRPCSGAWTRPAGGRSSRWSCSTPCCQASGCASGPRTQTSSTWLSAGRLASWAHGRVRCCSTELSPASQRPARANGSSTAGGMSASWVLPAGARRASPWPRSSLWRTRSRRSMWRQRRPCCPWWCAGGVSWRARASSASTARSAASSRTLGPCRRHRTPAGSPCGWPPW